MFNLHDPARAVAPALDALESVGPGAMFCCVSQLGLVMTPNSELTTRLGTAAWMVSDEHPLAFIYGPHHNRVLTSWLDAATAPDRLAHTTVELERSVPTDRDVHIDPGQYHLMVVDLLATDPFDTVVVALSPASDEPQDHLHDNGSAVPAWIQEGTSFRLQIDPQGLVRAATINVVEVFGRSIAELADKQLTPLIHPEDLTAVVASFSTFLRTGDNARPIRLRLLRGDGTWRWFEARSWNALADPKVRGIIIEFRDISKLIAAEELRVQTAQAHKRLVEVVDELADIVMVGCLGQGLLYANRTAFALVPGLELGVPLATYSGEMLQLLGSKEIEPALRRGEPWTGDLRFRLEDGQVHTLATTVTPIARADNDEIHFGIVMRDVTLERSHARELAQQARRDHLTGLPNRLALVEHLELIRNRPTSTAVLFVDVDNLKVVNDGLGHHAGDRLLIALAEALSTENVEILARFGGDEFVAVADGSDPGAVSDLAVRLLRRAGEVSVRGIATDLTTSIGVAIAPPGTLDPDLILSDADAAMYEAKRQGRAGVVLFNETLRERAQRRFNVDTSLREALTRGEVTAHFQPVVSIRTGKVVGFEALARWSGGDPGEFIKVAEESGLIITLGDRILRLALDGLSAIRHGTRDPHLRIAVNVSGRQLLDRDYVDRTLGIIGASEVDPADITLELTESVFIDPSDEVIRVLRRLRDGGLSLALDDFGSGYSSLGQLRRYPIDGLKVDTSYTQALLHDPETRIITDALVSMSDRLGLSVIAEGVETADQLDVIESLGISAAQGFLLGRPVPVDQLDTARLTSIASILPTLKAERDITG